MSSLPMTYDDCDKVANVGISYIRQVSLDSRRGVCGHSSGD